MPTIFTHPAVPVALAIGAGSSRISKRLLIAGIILSILPDFDVISFKFGIAYANILGHRGLSHSLVFALAIALIAACLFRWFKTPYWRTFLFLLVSVASHSVLDAFTRGGLGVALLWPWSEARFLSPLRPIIAAPFSVSRLFSAHGLPVFKSELLWVWLPCLSLAIMFCIARIFSPKARRIS